MRGLFKSTYSQLTLMFGLLLLINFVIIILSMRQITFSPAARQMALQLNNQLISIKPLLINKNIDKVESIIQNIFPSGQIKVTQNPKAGKLPQLKFYQELEKQLKQQQIEGVLFKESKDEAMLWIKPTWAQNYWLGVTFQPFMKDVSRLFVIVIVVLLFLSLLAAYIFSRYMLKPLKQLAHVATDIAENKPMLKTIKDSGTTEVREIVKLVRLSAQKIQKLNKEKELLLAGVSHDLRTPLARMRLQAEFLSDEEARDNLIQDIEEMDQIIGDFVTYVRLGTTEKFQKSDLVLLIKESIKLYAKTGNNIEFNISDKSYIMSLKPLCIKRMLNNIFDNALKYGQAPVQVTIEQNNSEVIICIRDHGKGVDETELASVFDPFVMAQTKDNQYGSGLGLSIVKKLAQQNNAQVRAENHKNGGLQICIIFNS